MFARQDLSSVIMYKTEFLNVLRSWLCLHLCLLSAKTADGFPLSLLATLSFKSLSVSDEVVQFSDNKIILKDFVNTLPFVLELQRSMFHSSNQSSVILISRFLVLT